MAAPAPDANRPLKLALVGSLPPWKGISPYCEALVRALAELTNPTPMAIEFLDFEQLYPTALYPGASMVRQGEAAPTDLPDNLRHRRALHYCRAQEAFKIGRSLDADLLHIQFWSEILAPAFAMLIDGFRAGRPGLDGRPRPVVMTLHNLAPHETAVGSITKRISQAWKAPFAEEAVRRADHWVVHYAAGRRELAAKLPLGADSRIHIIPHGLLQPRSATVAPTAVIDRVAARRQLQGLGLSIDPARPLLLLFGNLRAYKGVDIALQALAQTTGRGAQAQLLVAGAPWKDFHLENHLRLEAELQLSSRVAWRASFVPDAELAIMLAAADGMLLPYTRFDAMSGVASLGLRAGVPTIVSRVGGLSDMLPPSVVDRLSVPPGDPAALAVAMDRLLGDAELQAEAAHPPAEFLERFRWPTVAAATRRLYEQAMTDV